MLDPAAAEAWNPEFINLALAAKPERPQSMSCQAATPAGCATAQDAD
ncbi:MAG: hypothetical protein IPN34_02280 [Planctomycetes bacterium]|nr:hypothetical protein [Planctomycetota bacterium]